MNAKTGLAIALALLAPAACGGEGDAKEVEMRDAQWGWNATNHSLASAYAQFVAHVEIEEFGAIDLECADGGALHLQGRMSEQRDFELDGAFDDCTDEGVVLDGDLTLTASLELFVDEESAAAFDHDDIRALVIVDYHGLLQLDGAAAGTCVMDAQVHANALIFEGFASTMVVVDGELCGIDANAVVHGHGAV